MRIAITSPEKNSRYANSSSGDIQTCFLERDPNQPHGWIRVREFKQGTTYANRASTAWASYVNPFPYTGAQNAAAIDAAFNIFKERFEWYFAGWIDYHDKNGKTLIVPNTEHHVIYFEWTIVPLVGNLNYEVNIYLCVD
ncbi:MAG: hypothetical protein C5B59_02375 [Bacteroidetes bacterium]|nr:MAG: hypothetical protein C5B59_02375 [Bacteroidota bacterium]